MPHSAKTPPDTGLWTTLRGDLRTTVDDARRTGYRRTVSQTLDGLESYYLTDAKRQELAHMHRVRRFFYRAWWLFKALFYKLAPGRRVLLVIGLVAVLVGVARSGQQGQANVQWALLGIVCVLLVLMLELREKLVARDELAEGRAIQRALFPRTSPAIPGFDVWLDTIPANDVGGDVVDVLEEDDGRFFLLLGDVAGKGLGAALLAARFQATFRALAPDASGLDALGGQLNRIFYRDGPSNRFVTAVALAGRRGDPTLRVLNAGHPAPLLIRGMHVTPLPGGGPALGIVPGAHYADQSLVLEAGDALLIYSDGVTEASNASAEFFDEARLMAVAAAASGASPAELGNAIKDAVRAFEGGEKPHDDLSLIVVKVA